MPPAYHSSNVNQAQVSTMSSVNTDSSQAQAPTPGSSFPFAMPYPSNQAYQPYFYPPPPLPSGYNPFANPYPMGKC